MDNISFLDDKNDKKKKSDKGSENDPKWSMPEKAPEKKGGFFSFLKKPAGVEESREQVLKAIGEQEVKDQQAPSKGLSGLFGKKDSPIVIPGKPADAINLLEAGMGETGIDSSRIGVFNRLMDWLSKRKKKIIELSDQASAPAPADSFIEKAEESQEAGAKDKKTKKEVMENSSVLETNLLEGESISFFDWQAKGTMLATVVILSAAAVGLAYGGLSYWEKNKKAELLAIEAKLDNINVEIVQAKEDTKQYSSLEKKIRLVSVLLAKHIYWTNFFKFLEDNTIRDVYYMNFSGDNKGRYTIASRARSFNNMTEQLRVLKEQKAVLSANITGGKVSTEGNDSVSVSFNLDILLDANLFNKP